MIVFQLNAGIIDMEHEGETPKIATSPLHEGTLLILSINIINELYILHSLIFIPSLALGAKYT